jgi:hypothetical protein
MKGEYKFDPKPWAENHMCHWKPWAEKFKDAEGEAGTLARMLGYANEEIDRLCKNGLRTSRSQSALLFAFINLVESLPWWKRGFVKAPSDNSKNPLKDVSLLNKWRANNTLNIKDWDDA